MEITSVEAVKLFFSPIAAMVIWFFAMRLMKGKSRMARIIIGMPSMVAIMVLMLTWIAQI
jgi:hypothetical protein